MNYSIQSIDPVGAERMLGNNASNRHIRPLLVKKYASDMAEGRWEFTPAPICLSPAGEVTDGQHRLSAIIESGCTLEFLVVYNDTSKIKDIGAPRSVMDLGHYQGIEMTGMAAAVSRAMLRTQNPGLSGAQSKVAILEFFKNHKEAILFACEPTTTHRALCAPVRAAIALASYYEDHSRLCEFKTCLISGEMHSSDDSACIALRNWLLGLKSRSGLGIDVIKRAQSAISHFCSRRGKTKNYASKELVYTVPN